MMWRVLSYFGPYRRAGLVVVGCIAVQAVLGLALLSRINTDIDGVEDVVADAVFGPISSILVTVAALALMLVFSCR